MYNPSFRGATKGASEKSAQALHNRREALKKFRPGDPVVISGGISGEFIRAEGSEAIVLINRREQKINPLNLSRSGKKY